MTRVLTAVLFGIFLSVSSAHAQHEVTPQTGKHSESHIDAARQHLSTLLLDTGMLSEVALTASNLALSQARERVRAAPFFVSLPAERQQAVLDYLMNSGPIFQEEAIRRAPVLINNFAPRFAALFSETEFNDITGFMRTEHGASAFRKTFVANAVYPPTLTSDERDAFRSFSETAGGAVFTSRWPQLQPLMGEIGYAATSAPDVRARLQRDLCEIVGPDCPAAWRTDL